MLFDVVSGLIIIGLLVRRWRALFKSKVGIIVSLVIAIAASSILTPIYSNVLGNLGINIDTSSKAVSFIVTFITTYIIVAVPALILSVLIIGGVIILALALGVSYLNPNIQSQILNNSKLYPLISPLITQLHALISSIGG